jgi:hypothetical protein
MTTPTTYAPLTPRSRTPLERAVRLADNVRALRPPVLALALADTAVAALAVASAHAEHGADAAAVALADVDGWLTLALAHADDTAAADDPHALADATVALGWWYGDVRAHHADVTPYRAADHDRPVALAAIRLAEESTYAVAYALRGHGAPAALREALEHYADMLHAAVAQSLTA